MENLIIDIYTHVCLFLNNTEILNLLSMTKRHHSIKDKVAMFNPVYITQICDLWYYNSFRDVNVCKPIKKSIGYPLFRTDSGSRFKDMDVTRIVYPNNITHLEIHNLTATENIPETVTHLTCRIYADKNIYVYIPNNVTHLTFKSENICDINVISVPKSVTHLFFSHFVTTWENNYDNRGITINGDKEIKKYIPSSVIYFETEIYSENTAKDIFPDSVKEICVGHHANNGEVTFPFQLTTFRLTSGYAPEILPSCLTHLDLITILPSNMHDLTHLTQLTHLKTNGRGPIPNSVTHLTLGRHCDRTPDQCNPHSIQSLTIQNGFNDKINSTFPKLAYLHFSDDFDQTFLPEQFPVLKHLHLGDRFNQRVVIPSSVTCLAFGDKFNKYDIISATVTDLTVGYHFKHDYHDKISNVVRLTLTDLFNRPIDHVKGHNLSKIKFGENYSCILPSNLLSYATEILLHRNYPGEIDRRLYPIISFYT